MYLRLACVLAMLGACNKDNIGDGSTNLNLKPKIGLDLPHIVGFAVGGGASAHSVDGTAMADGFQQLADGFQQLYAIDDQGNLIVTTLTTSPEGDPDTMTASVTPSEISDTPKYEVFEFQNLHIGPNDAGQQCSGVIMRKADGALFCYEGGNFNHAGSLAREVSVQSNGADLLFVLGAAMDQGSTAGVQRIDMASDPPSAVSAAEDEATHDFSASLDGDVLVNLDRNPVQQTRIYKQGGGLQNLVASRSLQWLESGGHAFYYAYVDPANSGTYDVMKATHQSDGTYAIASAGTVPVYSTTNAQPTSFAYLALLGPDVAYLWRGADIVNLIGPTQGTEYILGDLTGFAIISDVRASASSLFIQGTDAAGNGGISRIDVPAFTATAILPPGEFSLTAISPSKTGELSFAGVRNSDGRRVIGKVPAGASTYTISDESAPTVTYLTRID